MSKSILFLTCARNGSKGVVDKNIIDVAGKPLMHYTLELLREFGDKADLVLSTDGDPIKSSCEGLVDYIVDRPDELAGDEIGRTPVLKHALEKAEEYFAVQYDYIFDFLVTAPIRNNKDIQACLDYIEQDHVDNVITAVPSHRNPYFNMVELKEGAPKVVMDETVFVRRQDAPATYDMNGSIYAWKRKSFLEGAKLFTSKTKLHVMDERSGVDVDTEFDLEVLRSLLK